MFSVLAQLNIYLKYSELTECSLYLIQLPTYIHSNPQPDRFLSQLGTSFSQHEKSSDLLFYVDEVIYQEVPPPNRLELLLRSAANM